MEKPWGIDSGGSGADAAAEEGAVCPKATSGKRLPADAAAIPAEAPPVIAILRLDTDWYDSTMHELEHLYDRVPSGGVLIMDDYGFWQGARQAVDEFLDRTGERLLLVPAASGRIAVKP